LWHHPVIEDVNKCHREIIDPFLLFMYEVICDSNLEAYNYLLNSIASIIQNIGKLNEVAVIITGQQGSGKNCFTDVLCELFRGYSSTITDLNDIIQYNESLFGKVFVVLDEMEKAKKGNSKSQQQLKALITKSMIQFKGKYKVTHEEKNTTNFFILSNNKVPFEIEMDDRHFFILKTNGKYANDHTYFSSLMKSFNSSFYSHFLTFLLNVNLKEFDSRKIPYTDAKKEMQNCSCSDPMIQ
jgi:hypothetical protein